MAKYGRQKITKEKNYSRQIRQKCLNCPLGILI